MAKVHYRKARKDYPDHGIAKGDMYYYAKIKTGPRSSRELRSKTPFPRSALTSSEFLSAIYDLEDRLARVEDFDEAKTIADELRELGQEQQDKFDNMPDGLQQGDSGQTLEQRAAGCEAAADEIETLVDSWVEPTGEEPEDEVVGPDTTEDGILGQVRNVCIDY